jgi:hypothetical protein
MFERVHRVEAIVRLVREKVPHYGPMLKSDLHAFRDESVNATVAAGIAAVSGLMFACFFSVAVIITAWGGGFRIAAAWTVCGIWAALAAVGLWYARKATSGAPPFPRMSAALGRDYRSVLALIDSDDPAHPST